MAIPSRQIGGSTRTNLLWQISKQLEELICVRAGGCGSTTTTTTTSSVTNYNVAGCERMEYHVITYTGGDILPEGTVVKNATPECWYIVDPTTNPADVGTVVEIWPTPADCEGCILSNPTTTTTTTPAYRYYNVIGYGCQPFCNEVGNFTAFVPYGTPLIIGSFYNNPENRGYSFLIVDELATSGQYDLTGEPAYDKCDEACTGPTTTTTTTAPLVNTNTTFVSCGFPCGPEGIACAEPQSYYDVWMTQECIDTFPTVGCQVFLNDGGSVGLPFPTGTYNDGFTNCIYIVNGMVSSTPPPVFTNNTFVNCVDPCGVECSYPEVIYFSVWMSQECINSWPQVGCQVWLDENETEPFPTGSYNPGYPQGCIYINNGVVVTAP